MKSFLKTNLIWSMIFMLLLPMTVLLGSCSDDKKEEKAPENTSFSWAKASVAEVENKLKEACKKQDANINSLVSSVKSNENVADAFISNDKQSLIVKFKGDEIYTAYPVNLIPDPFAGEDAQEPAQAATNAPKRANAAPQYKKTGSRGVVAVFNYFSYLTNRKAQNQILEFMMQDLNDHEYGVEYYPYENMTYENLKKVKDYSENYTAVIIMSHGVSDGNYSYFAIGEEYESAKRLIEQTDFIGTKDTPKEENSWLYRMWNGDDLFGGGRYDCMLTVGSMMSLSPNTILYMGSCNAFEHYSYDTLKERGGTCIGWDGTNCCAQAHVAVLFYKLMRGKTLRGALDLKNQLDPYYEISGDQYDTWFNDPLYTNTKLAFHMDGIYQMGETIYGVWNPAAPPHYFSSEPNYYKSGHFYMISPGNSTGIYFKSERNVKMGIRMYSDGISDSDDLYPKTIYIKATPLRAGAKEKIVKLKRKKRKTELKYNYDDFSMFFSSNCPYSITAAIDEDFKREIMFYNPIIFIFGESFKDNGLAEVPPEEEEIETFNVNGVSFNMVNVEGGTFMMGAPDDDKYADDSERPQHQVTLSSYSIGQTEVTQALWEAVMGSNPSKYKGSDRPVEQVSWNDCQEFIKKLNALTGRTFRLPTEAEWEYAARGGLYHQGYQFSGSNEIKEVAWYLDNSGEKTHPVAQKASNDLGIYDMTGNVWEWCQDWFDMDYYSNSPSNNPCNNTVGNARQRVQRGGSWFSYYEDCRVWDREAMKSSSEDPLDYKEFDLGLRLAM